MTVASTDDRRQYSRIAFHSPARLVFPDRGIDVVVIDLSLKGALIRLPAEALLDEDAVCILRIQLDTRGIGDQISMKVRICHSEGRYAGLSCTLIDLDSVTHLRRLVELNLGDPKLLDRELSALLA